MSREKLEKFRCSHTLVVKRGHPGFSDKFCVEIPPGKSLFQINTYEGGDIIAMAEYLFFGRRQRTDAGLRGQESGSHSW